MFKITKNYYIYSTVVFISLGFKKYVKKSQHLFSWKSKHFNIYKRFNHLSWSYSCERVPLRIPMMIPGGWLVQSPPPPPPSSRGPFWGLQQTGAYKRDKLNLFFGFFLLQSSPSSKEQSDNYYHKSKKLNTLSLKCLENIIFVSKTAL